MFPKNILGVLIFSVFVFASSAYAGKAELTAYYPSAYGEYKNLKSTADASFATSSGVVGIGAIANSTAQLEVYGRTAAGTSQMSIATPTAWAASLYQLMIQFNDSTRASMGGICMGTDASSAKYVGTSFFAPGTSNPISFCIQPFGGNVGIGTTNITDIAGTTGSDLTLTGSIAQDGWTAPTLLNGWVNYSATFNPAGYFRDKTGIVHLRGLVRSGTVTAGTAIFTLPAGYRPARLEIFSNVAYTTIYVYGRCDVNTAGNVNFYAGGNAFFSLDGITFRASGY